MPKPTNMEDLVEEHKTLNKLGEPVRVRRAYREDLDGITPWAIDAVLEDPYWSVAIPQAENRRHHLISKLTEYLDNEELYVFMVIEFQSEIIALCVWRIPGHQRPKPGVLPTVDYLRF